MDIRKRLTSLARTFGLPLVVVGLAVILVACPATAGTGTVTITIDDGTITVEQGQSASATVTVTAGGGFDGDVTISASGHGPDVTVTFDPNPVATLRAGAGLRTQAQSTITVEAMDDATIDTTTVTITASASGVADATTTFELEVTERTVVTSEQLSEALDAMLANAEALATKLAESDAGLAVGGFPTPDNPPPPPRRIVDRFVPKQFRHLLLGSLLWSKGLGALQPLVADYPLDRGEYEWDAMSGMWVLVASSDDLLYRWYFDDEPSSLRPQIMKLAELLFDWDATAPTTEVVDASGGTFEVPTGMAASLTAGVDEVASADLGASWADIFPCGPILEPGSLALSLLIGVGTTLGFDADFAITENAVDTFATDGAITLDDGTASVAFFWDVLLAGTLVRTDCFISDFILDETEVTLDLTSSENGTSYEFALSFEVDNIDPFTGAFDLDGVLTLNGATAVAFSGRLDDADGDGVPGENVTLTYGDGSTETLEELLNRLSMPS